MGVTLKKPATRFPDIRIARSLLVVGVNFLILEIGCYVILTFAAETRPNYFDWEYFVRSVDHESARDFMAKAYDADLGWNTQPNSQITYKNSAGLDVVETYDAVGARTNPQFVDEILASSYGDSWTQGAEVSDSLTWQYFLSTTLGSNVQNFGVGAYGTDQALLKLERDLKRGNRTPIIILGILEMNINRIVNTYRPFYYPAAGMKFGFKPRFILRPDGDLELIPNPMSQYSDRSDALAALEVAKEHDFWFRRSESRIRISFPFSITTLDLLWRVLHRKGFVEHPFWEDRAELDTSLWHMPNPSSIMERIIDRFHSLGRDFGFRPFVLFMPSVALREDGTIEDPTYLHFVSELRARYRDKDLTVIDISEANFDPTRFRIRPEAGHASAYGNRIIADYVLSYLVNKR